MTRLHVREHGARARRDQFLSVIVGLNVLNFVGPWLQFSILKDGRGTGRTLGHRW